MTRDWQAGDRLDVISIDLTLRRAIQAVGATRDYYPVHHDAAFARASGARDIFFNTMFLQAFAGRCAAQWFGYDAFLRRLEVAMHGSNYVGRTLTAEGTVTGTRESNGCVLVDADVSFATEDGPTTAVKLSVQLPPAVTP